jgi:hypothetical protein
VLNADKKLGRTENLDLALGCTAKGNGGVFRDTGAGNNSAVDNTHGAHPDFISADDEFPLALPRNAIGAG